MKARTDAILHLQQAEYLESLHPQNTGLLAEMELHASEHRVPIADREVARFLEITTRAIGARRVLEIGMAIGYAVIHLARAMAEGGLVVTIEPDDEMISRAEDFLKRAGLRERVRIERGRALDVLPGLSESFDLVYIDALKEEYADYLELSFPLIRLGGVVVVDNLLWGGQVAGEIKDEKQRRSTESLRRFNEVFVNHQSLLAEILPVGDGLGYAVRVR